MYKDYFLVLFVRAAHEAGAATAIVNLGETRADKFVPLKINARLGEVRFQLNHIFLNRVSYGIKPFLMLMHLSCRYCQDCLTLDPLVSLFLIHSTLKLKRWFQNLTQFIADAIAIASTL